jgi:hypothetical protein
VSQRVVFQPEHAGVIWAAGVRADCRNPTVIKADGVYYLYYTGTDEGGGIIGAAQASSPLGPWTDLGAIAPPFLGHSLKARQSSSRASPII